MKIQRLCSVQGVMSHFSVIGYSNDDLERQVNKIDSNPVGFISLLCDTCAGKKKKKNVLGFSNVLLRLFRKFNFKNQPANNTIF